MRFRFSIYSLNFAKGLRSMKQLEVYNYPADCYRNYKVNLDVACIHSEDWTILWTLSEVIQYVKRENFQR